MNWDRGGMVGEMEKREEVKDKIFMKRRFNYKMKGNWGNKLKLRNVRISWWKLKKLKI